MGYGKNTWSQTLLDEEREIFGDAGAGGYSTGTTKGKGKGGYSVGPRCHETHKELSIGGGTLLGASCNSPRKGFDVYVGFDWGMQFNHVQKPWDLNPEVDPVIEGLYKISDMSTPEDPESFERMVVWVCDQLKAGKRVHIGCIGGHGRTGLVMSVIVSKLMPEVEDPVKWVRENHCKKAVETKGQIDWLAKHYGIKTTVAASKGWSSEAFDNRYPQHGKHKGKAALHGDTSAPFPTTTGGGHRTPAITHASPVRHKNTIFTG